MNAITHVVCIYSIDGEDVAATPTPPCVQSVLDDFEDVFKEPEGLPPRRAYDHRIPLILGAQPVNIRPYRHKPDHKNEIEAQVKELLRKGIIQKSNNPFA